MPAPLKGKSGKSPASTAWRTKTEEMLEECADDSVWKQPTQNIGADAGSPGSRGSEDSGLGGTTSSSDEESGCAVSPGVPNHLQPSNPSTAPDRLSLSRTNSQFHLDHQRLIDSLATFRETLVANHVQTLSILDVELDRVKNGLAAAAVTAVSLASKSGSKSSSKEVKVKLPGALAASAEDPPGKCLKGSYTEIPRPLSQNPNGERERGERERE